MHVGGGWNLATLLITFASTAGCSPVSLTNRVDEILTKRQTPTIPTTTSNDNNNDGNSNNGGGNNTRTTIIFVSTFLHIGSQAVLS